MQRIVMGRKATSALCALALALVVALALAVTSTSVTSAAGTRSQAGGTLTVGASQGIPQLNPAIWTFAWEETLLPMLWDGLTEYTRSGSVGPDLATSWTPAQGGRQWTFHLRSGVKFSNGKPFTSSDVVSNFKYYLKSTTPYHDQNQISLVTSVTAAGPLTVVFKLSHPDAILPAGVSGVKMIYLPALSTIDSKPIGTGPFVVKSFVPNGPLSLVKNPSYWGPAPSLNEIDISNQSDPTSAYTNLASGSLDVLWNIPYSYAPRITHDSSLKLVTPFITSQYTFWEMDTSAPPFNDLRARQALAYATDRVAMQKAAFFGQATLSPGNDPLATNNSAYNKQLNPYPYDLAKAKKLFAEAGVKKLTWWGIAGSYPQFAAMGQILQASLKKIGIPLDIQNRDISTWAAKFYPAGKSFPGMVVPNANPSPPEPAYLLNFFLKGVCQCNWTNPTFTKLYNQAIATVSPSARQVLWNQLQAIVNKEVPVIIPNQSDYVVATRSNIAGVWLEGGGQMHLEQASLTH